ncbi:MAG: hypothetical protein HN758_09860 [Verrucomicrobia bacterium]|nr:hypothetical protein [Verrucomicrobiota bacterium]MBT4275690.1 hypothetical protein [Verrucomicrobiota bacterium]MBT6239345.1 hypothetical protein [Verrucomicrobiota bacterium]MBT6806248.1 hypothetical protein [Verrucomicrobiota bacterium]MBT7874719.1 hypothetical protein [Verrucomicrobiota bacterium]
MPLIYHKGIAYVSNNLMKKLKAITYFLLGSALLLSAVMTPAYLRSVDSDVLRIAGGKPELISEGFSLLRLEKSGPAHLLFQSARFNALDDVKELEEALGKYRSQDPKGFQQGDSDALIKRFLDSNPSNSRFVLGWMVASNFRKSVLNHLQQSNRPGVQTILKNRNLQSLNVFYPVASAGGQPFDSALLLTGLLYQEDHLSSEFGQQVELLAAQVNLGKNTRHLEAMCLDILSLSKRMNWGQLTTFIQKVESVETLRTLTHHAMRSEEMLPRVFSSLRFAESGGLLADYLRKFPETAPRDIQLGIVHGQEALRHLLQRQEPVFVSSTREWLRSYGLFHAPSVQLCKLTLRMPMFALLIKYLLYLFGSFFILRFLHQLKPEPEDASEQMQVDGIGFLRQQILALVFLVFVIVLGEPFLAQDSKKVENTTTWRFPVMQSAVTDDVESIMETKITQITIIALVLFFLVQVCTYALCLVKLKEIKKQEAHSRLKLRLLDNEENLFDSGLYLGLGGTVLSLVMLALGIVKPGLMAAYSSTLFGIIFVSALKIFHVRPYRRKLIVENETERA